MIFENLDITIIIIYFLLCLFLGWVGRSKGSGFLQNFFVSSRNMPWWLAGSSMVATTFAADTPLWVAGQVGNHGIVANWLWWSMAAGGLLTVFFFSRLWRRAGVLTDLEFIELRYSGLPAAFLRAFRALYSGIILNCIVMAWVNLALLKICQVLLPAYNPQLVVILCLSFTLIYVCIGGLGGISFVDTFQFFIALGACIVLAIFAMEKANIFDGEILSKSLAPNFLNFFPTFSTEITEAGTKPPGASPLDSFLIYAFILWWACWYPGAEPGGGGYITQRILSARDEKQGLLATLWFVIAHYCIRSWPWIIAALAAAIIYPELEGSQKELGFVYLIRDVLPAPIKGLLFAALLGAYMSTLSTHLNWGTSYFINDIYKRFLVRKKKDRHYAWISQLCILVLALISLFISFNLINSIQEAWGLLLEGTAGIGFVLILRWYWWRINVWSEFAAMLTPIFLLIILKILSNLEVYSIATPQTLIFIVPISILIILLVSFLSPQERKSHLLKFYNRVRPLGPGWYTITKKKTKGLSNLFLAWGISLILVYSFLFLIGSLLFKNYIWIISCSFLVIVTSIALVFIIKKEFSSP